MPKGVVITADTVDKIDDRAPRRCEAEHQAHLQAGGGSLMDTLKLSPMSQTLATVIPFGKRNAISRAALAEKLQLGDRHTRRAIEIARNEGIIILNDQDGRGYYQSADAEDLGRQYIQDTDRAMSILKRRKHLRLILKEMGELEKYEKRA